ncbi:transposase [Candidatus Arsenophonus triatominarum]|uniref:transposase n=1 Tax=Candidatus Arsenophonus triatominarum TaxID=57911 RepID=UPI001396967C
MILTICRDLNITPGVFTAIHTWGRDQKWHPHIHFSTTAGGVTKKIPGGILAFIAKTL